MISVIFACETMVREQKRLLPKQPMIFTAFPPANTPKGKTTCPLSCTPAHCLRLFGVLAKNDRAKIAKKLRINRGNFSFPY